MKRNIKQLLAITIVVIIVIMLAIQLSTAAVAVESIETELVCVDIGVETSEELHEMTGWGPIEPDKHGGYWGGISGNCRVTWYPNQEGLPMNDTHEATLKIYAGRGFAYHIQMKVLDGIADDSFNVYVRNPGGNWVLVYSYIADPSTTEYWVDHDIYSFPAGKGQGNIVEIKIEATGAPWAGFNTYGQLAVDKVRLLGK